MCHDVFKTNQPRERWKRKKNNVLISKLKSAPQVLLPFYRLVLSFLKRSLVNTKLQSLKNRFACCCLSCPDMAVLSHINLFRGKLFVWLSTWGSEALSTETRRSQQLFATVKTLQPTHLHHHKDGSLYPSGSLGSGKRPCNFFFRPTCFFFSITIWPCFCSRQNLDGGRMCVCVCWWWWCWCYV